MLDYYNLIRTNVQILNVELVTLECRKSENISGELDVDLNIERKVGSIDKEKGEIYLESKFEAKNEDGVMISVFSVFKGYCKSTSDTLEEEDFKSYLYEQVVPLLLPYARECIASTMTRMNLQPFYIPTMDVLSSLKVNKEGDLVNEPEV